jgi:hypothetical protein
MVFFQIPLLLLIVALQATASRRESTFWKAVNGLLTASAFLAVPWLLYLRTLIQQPGRALSADNSVRLIRLGSSVYVEPVIQRSLTLGLAAAVAIAAYGCVARLVKHRASRQLVILEIISWLAFLAVAALFTVLAIALARSGFNH